MKLGGSRSCNSLDPTYATGWIPFGEILQYVLENESSPEIKSQIIQKVVDRIIVKSDSIKIYFFVGESHYKKEINISSQQGAGASSLSLPEKRHTGPLPVFHGNPKTSEFLFLKPNLTPNFFYDAGSNSLKNGREYRKAIPFLSTCIN
ncbi:MAG: hypothetical protein WA160_06475 [Pseudobdellovibrio sp.]